MKVGYSRKLSLIKYGGNQYETADVWAEAEDMTFEEIKKEVDKDCEQVIQELQKDRETFEEAQKSQPPFIK